MVEGQLNKSGLNPDNFRKTLNGKEINLYTLRNSEGNEVSLTNYGGAVVAIMVPDKNGRLANVIQGHDNIDDVINSPEPFLSTLVGRYANRIAKGKFVLNGKDYYLAINNGPNHLHGGPTGFHTKSVGSGESGRARHCVEKCVALLRRRLPRRTEHDCHVHIHRQQRTDN